MSAGDEIGEIINASLRGVIISGKVGKKVLQPMIASAIDRAGYQADTEDKEVFLREKLPVWRSKDHNQKVEITKTRRKIDIVVRQSGQPVALIETESDLNDLRLSGITKRNGHYDVLSIARSADGEYFNSYKSLERMAAALYYFYLNETKSNLLPEEATARIEAIQSNDPSDHNPMGIPLFLVTGSSRSYDEAILKQRLLSLNASLISGISK